MAQEASKGGDFQGAFGAFMSVPNVTMAKGGGGGGQNYGASGSLGMVLERSKLEFVMPTPPQQAPKLDDGGSGGDSGKNIHNGGGGGDGDDGDDDDYFGEEGDGDGDGQGGGGGDGFFRTALPELYDRLTIAAVLQEWYKTIADLPLFIRRAVEMGLFSSAQLVRFLSMDVRPNLTRSVSRALPSEVSAHAGVPPLGICIAAAGLAGVLLQNHVDLVDSQQAPAKLGKPASTLLCFCSTLSCQEQLICCRSRESGARLCACMHTYRVKGSSPRDTIIPCMDAYTDPCSSWALARENLSDQV